ncbi:hypothetical protein ACFVTJ_24035 [Agrobacterium sp. NPDC058088]|uniref:hypothetical protein n=1 Tax=Agrobacterium sp. NPDC058088 TaxID=3346335 RepID=UPI0036DE287D
MIVAISGIDIEHHVSEHLQDFRSVPGHYVSSGSEAWMTPVLSLPLILFACGNALSGRKMVSRIRSFNDRFGSWHF